MTLTKLVNTVGGTFAGLKTMEAVVKVLEEAGVKYVFGMPGGYMGHLYDSLLHSSIEPILVRHEQIASIMAETYGRLTGIPGVYTSQGAWTISNGMMGPLEAIQGSSPMIVLTDMTDNAPFSHQGSYQVGTGEYGGYDVKKVLEASTKYSTTVHHPVQAVQSVQLALKHATEGNMGPTGVVFHSSAINGTVTEENAPTIYPTHHYLVGKKATEDRSKLEVVLQVLLQAEKPFVIAGNGVKVADAYTELREFAEKLGVPVGTTAQGKSAIAETHPNAVGVIGNWGQEVANTLLGEADVIFAVGTKLAPTDTANHAKELIDPTRQVLIHIDIEPRNVSWTFPIDYPLVGDAKRVLQDLNNLLDEQDLSARELEKKVEELNALKAESTYMYCEEMLSDSQPILPQRLLRELQEFVDEDTVLALDAGENRVYTVHYFKTKAPGSMILPGSAGGMGYALPSALGAKLAMPDKKVIAIAGDGGFAMTMNGLLTAAQYTIPVVTIVMNNSVLGWVKNAQGDDIIASEFGEVDFAAIARSMGCQGYTVTDPNEIKGTLEKAFATGRPAVLDIKTTDKESYQKVMYSLATSLEDK